MRTVSAPALRWSAPLPLARADAAPTKPGLYAVFRNGTLAYFGKAASLIDRVGHHMRSLRHMLSDPNLVEFTFRFALMPNSTDAQRARAERRRIDHFKKKGLLKYQRESEAVGEVDPFFPSPARAAWAFWQRQLEVVARAFREQRYGCWCGPGNVCDTVTDELDRCCQAHDRAYAAVGVSSGSGGISMWSIEGLKRTEAADDALVACAARNLNLPALGPAARAYARSVMVIFGTRARAARTARYLGL